MVTGNNQLSGLDLGKALMHFPKPNLHQEKVIVTIWWSDASLGASLLAQMVKHLPAMQETWVCSIGWEDPLEMGMATHSSILAWRILWTEEPGKVLPMGLQRVGHD